jgi:hypothetical protein
MRQRYWLGAAAALLSAGMLSISAEAAPAGAIADGARATIGDASTMQQAHYWWGRRYYRGYYYGPRRHYGYYGGYYRPYRSYGYGPSCGFYAGPRSHRRWWW